MQGADHGPVASALFFNWGRPVSVVVSCRSPHQLVDTRARNVSSALSALPLPDLGRRRPASAGLRGAHGSTFSNHGRLCL